MSSIFKEVNIGDVGAANKYGADDLLLHSRLFNGVVAGIPAVVVKSQNKWGFGDNVLWIYNTAGSKKTTIRGQSNAPSVDVDLALPPIVGNDTLAALALQNVFTVKQEMDAGLLLKEMAVPSNPSTTFHHLFVDSADGHLKRKNSAGVLIDFQTANGTAGGDLSGSFPNPGIAAGVIVDSDINATGITTRTKLPAAIMYTDAANTITQTLSAAALLDIQQQLIISGDLSPTQITADQNDYNPSGITTKSILRLTSDQRRKITGLTGGTDGRIVVLDNVGNFSIMLPTESTASTAANRFSFPGSLWIAPNQSVTLKYDSTTSRWRQVSTDIPFWRGNRFNPITFNDFFSTTILTPWIGTAVSAGTIAAPNASIVTKDHPGVVKLVSSTTNNSGFRIMTDTAALLIGGGEMFEMLFNIVTLTNGTLRFGFHDTTTNATPTDGVFIEVPSTGAAVLKTINNTSVTTSSTIATLSTATWYRALISIDPTAANVTATIYSDVGASLGAQTNSANIPTAAGREVGSGVIFTNSGAVATDLIHIDSMGSWYESKVLERG